MKEKLIELFMQCDNECDNDNCIKCKYADVSQCGKHRLADILIANGVEFSPRPKKDENCTASLNYEAEYYRLLEERECLMAKMEFLRSEKESLESEFIRLRAQMDVVYLIFGGK